MKTCEDCIHLETAGKLVPWCPVRGTAIGRASPACKNHCTDTDDEPERGRRRVWPENDEFDE